jgi:hypothetical protein
LGSFDLPHLGDIAVEGSSLRGVSSIALERECPNDSGDGIRLIHFTSVARPDFFKRWLHRMDLKDGFLLKGRLQVGKAPTVWYLKHF